MVIADRAVIDAALAELGVRRLLFAMHSASFPADADEDVGRGGPATRASARLLTFARTLGFTGIQLGPEGQTSRDNPSPYDATIFSRDVTAIPLAAFAGLVDERTLAGVIDPRGGTRTDHRRAYDRVHALLDEAHAALAARPRLAARLAVFRREHASWLDRDALYGALCESHAGTSFRHWHEHGADPLDSALWSPPAGDEARAAARRTELARLHAPAIERYALGQLLAHEAHARARARCAGLGLTLYGDLAVGFSDRDAWSYGAAFLPDYVMGAPPSRTNPAGQPWGYPVLDPAQYLGDAGPGHGPGHGPALALVRARLDKSFAEYDSLRIDHPHGLVCPWVYRAGTADPGLAVRHGARLFESPDLEDHPALARFAIARPDQLDRSCPRHADAWARHLDDAQVARYSTLFDVIAASADAHGRDRASLSCEVLSTMPLPLQHVLARHRLGRWRVTQKASLEDTRDVYRAENAAPEDWVMLGNHDTAPVFSLIASWPAATREAWSRHLIQRLGLAAEIAGALGSEDGLLATAMLAELFASRAENVSIFFADLFGFTERFNAPGTVGDDNWSLRLPAAFEALYRERVARRAALDLPLALALALDARGSRSGLAAVLRASGGTRPGPSAPAT